MNWIELLFSRLPVGMEKLGKQILVRLAFLFLIWLTGLVAHAVDGMTTQYISNTQIYVTLFGSGLIVLFGSYMVQQSLGDTILSFRSLLKLDDSSFQELSGRIERYSYSFVPCLLIALPLTVFLSVGLSELQAALFGGIHAIWNLLVAFFLNLLMATGIWIGVSIWLTIFLISRQPLQVDPSLDPIEKFRGLTVVALWFSLFYFIAISIGLVMAFTEQSATPTLSMLFSPLLVFVVFGVVGILFPFYNIHKALLKLKNQELSKISEESEQLLQQLDEVLAKKPTRLTGDQTITILARLFSLQFKERNVKSAQEWPIDVGFLSKLIGICLIPIISRIAAMLIIS